MSYRKRKQRDIFHRDSAERLSGVAGLTSPLPLPPPLCDRCAKIDLDEVFSRQHKSSAGQLILILGPLVSWSVDRCALCSLLAFLLPREVPDTRQWELRSYSTRRIKSRGFNTVDTICLGIPGNSSYLISQADNPSLVRLLESSSIDYDIIKSWLRYCNESHTVTCALQSVIEVQYLKLIDCKCRKLVPAENHPYVFLSYMWGSDIHNLEYNDNLPENLPATIEDSMRVTLELGYQYLWVDRYCIDQSKAEEVKNQVEMMDLIYKNSQVTIIAAAGDDPSYGLPGVGRRARDTHPHANIGKRMLVSTLNDPREFIGGSPWNARGWTYQEAILSRKRLVFTNEQVYFECYGMYCCEALDFPLDKLHTQDKQRFLGAHCFGDNIGVFPRGVGKGVGEVLNRIEEYSQRSLSKDSDILNGIMGVLRVFASSPQKLQHMHGIPLILRRDEHWPSSTSGTHPYEERAMMKSFIAGLLWHSNTPTTRRPGFPSWSWAGWRGSIHWDYKWREQIHFSPYWRTDHSQFAHSHIMPLDISIIYPNHNHWISMRKYSSRVLLQKQPTLNDTLRIRAWTTEVKIIQRLPLDVQGTMGCSARIELKEGYIIWHFSPDDSETSLDRRFVGILLANGTKHLKPTAGDSHTAQYTPGMLIIREADDQGKRVSRPQWERFGFGWIDDKSFEIYNDAGVSEFYFRPMLLDWQRRDLLMNMKVSEEVYDLI